MAGRWFSRRKSAQPARGVRPHEAAIHQNRGLFTVGHSVEQAGDALAGWFSSQPLWDEIVRTDPDLFD